MNVVIGLAMILGTIGWLSSNKNRAKCRKRPELGDSVRDLSLPAQG